jgi:hypothetical protein
MSKSNLIMVIEGQKFEISVDSHSITHRGYGISVGADFSVKDEDQARLITALKRWQDTRGDIEFMPVEESV